MNFWQNIFMTLLALGVLTAGALVATAIVHPHPVEGYYISTSGTTEALTCIYADIPWSGDFKAYCSTDTTKLGQMYINLMATLQQQSVGPHPQLELQ